MKQFWIYTLARLVLLLVTFGAVTGAWVLLNDGKANYGLALIIAFVVSGIGSYFVLQGPRQALAERVEVRAAAATRAFEERRAREDVD